MKKYLGIVLLVILLDQSLKLWIKTHMSLGETIYVFGDWFQLYFTENPGMAFGVEFGGAIGKYALSIFRIIAAGFGFWYIHKLVVEKAKPGFIFSIALILAGALGNILDSMFYGLMFSDSYHGVAEFMPQNGGYAGFLQGEVVDMLYFPVWKSYFPDWLPYWGGEHFIFFRPIFNIADSSISVGVGVILLFQKSFFPKEEETENKEIVESEETETQSNNPIH